VHRLRGKGLAPYALLSPGTVWLLVFFVLPMFYLGKMSLETGLFPVFSFDWAWSNFSDAVSLYRTQFLRSLQYAGVATAIALVISYPLAYWIAFRGGQWKNLLLLLVIAPFFVTYLIRTLAWQTILSDNGIVVSTLQHLHILAPDGRLLATSVAVIAGITYNFLPFMVLPLYVSLEQVDPRLIEAAGDLYANRVVSFFRVTLPLSLPGVFAGVLLTFIPACGDFINAQLLGTPKQYMIGNVIQSQFLSLRNYPTAAALSFVLMGAILIFVLVFARARHRPADGRGRTMMARVRHRLLDVYALLALVYLFVPISVVIAFSFNNPLGRFNYTWKGFTLKNWVHPLDYPGLGSALQVSIEIAFLSALVATALGTLIALALVRYEFRGASTTNLLIFIPMATPEIVLGA
jgi:spermidine/putrescine transport system permease protein